MGTLFVGTAILVIAAFAPFLVLKLIPWTEAALVAHGVSRSPVRAANSTVGTVNSANSMARLAGGSNGTMAALPAGGSGNGWVVGAPVTGNGRRRRRGWRGRRDLPRPLSQAASLSRRPR